MTGHEPTDPGGPGEPDDIARQLEEYLADLTSYIPVAEPIDPGVAEYERIRQLEEWRSVDVLRRFGFDIAISEDHDLSEANYDYLLTGEQRERAFQTLTARYIDGQIEEAEMDRQYDEYVANHRALMQEADVYYYAFRIASYLAECQVNPSEIGPEEAADIIAHIDANQYFTDGQKRRMLEAARELIGDDTFTVARSIVDTEGLDVEIAARETVHFAEAGTQSEELNGIMAMLIDRLGASNVAHDDWLSLATGLRTARGLRQMAADNTGPVMHHPDLLDRRITQLRQRASRVGIDPNAFNGLLSDLGII